MAARGIGRWRVWAAGLVLLTLVAGWAVMLHQAEDSVFSRVPLLDERQYLESARDIPANGRDGLKSPERPFFMSPLYPRVLRTLGVKADPDDLVIPPKTLLPLRLFQILLWLGTLVLLRRLAGRLFAPQTGPGSVWLWLPSFLFLLYGPLAIYTMMALVEMPLVFLLTLFLYLCTGQNRVWSRVLLMGLVLGLAVLLRGSLMVLLPVGMLALCNAVGSKLIRWSAVGVFLLTVMLVLSPAVWHNSRLTGQLSPPTVNGGGLIPTDATAIGVGDGKNVVQTQSYGPEARGGASRADLVVSTDEIYYPKSMKLDMLLALTQEACDKYYPDILPTPLCLIFAMKHPYFFLHPSLLGIPRRLDLVVIR